MARNSSNSQEFPCHLTLVTSFLYWLLWWLRRQRIGLQCGRPRFHLQLLYKKKHSLQVEHYVLFMLPRWLPGKTICLPMQDCRFHAWVGQSPWTRKWQFTTIFLPWKSQGQRSLMDYSPWGRKESDTERTHILFIGHS